MQYWDDSVGVWGGGERFPYLVDVAVNPAERGLNRHAI